MAEVMEAEVTSVVEEEVARVVDATPENAKTQVSSQELRGVGVSDPPPAPALSRAKRDPECREYDLDDEEEDEEDEEELECEDGFSNQQKTAAPPSLIPSSHLQRHQPLDNGTEGAMVSEVSPEELSQLSARIPGLIA